MLIKPCCPICGKRMKALNVVVSQNERAITRIDTKMTCADLQHSIELSKSYYIDEAKNTGENEHGSN